MTGTNATAPRTTPVTASGPDRDLRTVRRREARHRGEDNPAVPPAAARGRTALAIGLDLAVHTGAAAGAFLAAPPTVAVPARLAAAVGAFALGSLLDRVVLQWAVRATAGKALTGLAVVRSSDGGRASLWVCLRAWLRDAYAAACLAGSALRDLT